MRNVLRCRLGIASSALGLVLPCSRGRFAGGVLCPSDEGEEVEVPGWADLRGVPRDAEERRGEGLRE